MAKRGHQEGSIRKRADGRWEGRVLLGHREGKAVRPSFYGETRALVKDQISTAVAASSGGVFAVATKKTVGDFLTDWLAAVKPGIREKTYRSYEQLAGLHLTPALGALPLKHLGPEHVQRCLNDLSASGRAPRTVQMVRDVLRMALEHALRLGAVSRNVAKLATAPRVPHKEVQPLSVEEAKAFFKSVENHRLAGLWECAVWTGLRQGELLGLRWSDVDLDKKELRVSRALQYVAGKFSLVEPKTARSRRTINLTEAAVAVLTRHQASQAQEQLLAGADWNASWNLVFATRRGTPLEGSRINRDLKKLLKDAMLRPQRFHDLRHTCASLLLASGVSPRTLMEWMGHSQISLTMNTYAHVMPAAKQDAADKLSALLG